MIDDREILRQALTINRHAHMAARAPLAILVCADTRLEKSPGYYYCAGLAENGDWLHGASWFGSGRDAAATVPVPLFRPMLVVALTHCRCGPGGCSGRMATAAPENRSDEQ